jgi:hypothetical protein
MALADIRNRVEQQLGDTSNLIWSTGWVDEGIRQALHRWSERIPQHAITTLTAASDTRELDLSTISGLLSVVRVWTPYTAANPEEPPNWRPFEHWYDPQLLYLPNYEIPSGDVVRIFYTLGQTVEDLDSATATTIPDHELSTLIDGAAGFAAIERGLDITEQVTLGRATSKEIRDWGQAKIDRFERKLDQLVKAKALLSQSRVRLPRQDRHDTEWS